jgi:hypothetical protein
LLTKRQFSPLSFFFQYNVPNTYSLDFDTSIVQENSMALVKVAKSVSNTTDATSGAGTAYPSGVSEFISSMFVLLNR